MTPNTQRRRNPSQRGVALVVILLCIILVTGIALAFFSKTSFSRQLAMSSAGQARAGHIAQLGLETLVADLAAEIAVGSTAVTNNGFTIYTPVTNSTAVLYSTNTNSALPNFAKMSASNAAFWGTNGYANTFINPQRASASPTDTASRNGRKIPKDAWNAPYLMGSNLPAGFPAPDWVLVTRSGPLLDGSTPPAIATLRDHAAPNANFCVGRFAFVIYNQGGLLDANLAGYPASVSPAFKLRKGLLPQADLSKIPGITDADAFIDWRNAGSKSIYENMVFADTSGLTKIQPGDQRLLGRKDLIACAKKNAPGFSLDALKFLSTESYGADAPTFVPPSAPVSLPASNPSFAAVRVPSVFTRASDGSEAVVGEPLLKHRFPLSRIALLSDASVSSATIETFFGLKSAGNNAWTYRNGASTILTLGAVAAAGREPDFFELLKAGIMHGSMGGAGALATSDTAWDDANTDRQIMMIGANIIDQFDGNSWPTGIVFNGETLRGIEDIPYLNRLYITAYRKSTGTPTNDTEVGVWLQPELWNPHAAGSPSTNRPSNFRIRPTGKVHVEVLAVGASQSDVLNEGKVTGPSVNLKTQDIIQVTPGNYDFRSAPVKVATANGGSAQAVSSIGTTPEIGFCVGTAIAPDKRIDTNATYAYGWIQPVVETPLKFELQYADPSGNWITYSTTRNVVNKRGGAAQFANNGYAPGHPTTVNPGGYFLHVDPRTDRFGLLLNVEALTGNASIRPTASPGENQQTLAPGNWSFSGYTQDSAPFGTFADNKPTSPTRYADPDGVIRGAEGLYANGSVGDGGYPLATGVSSINRPVMLDRPFRSVGEMGYAFRDLPWKNLDLFSEKSADMALLDLFCVYDNAKAVPAPAGLVDLNTAPREVLIALLTGAVTFENTSSALSEADAGQIADRILAERKGADGPFFNRADIVQRVIGGSGFQFGATRDAIVKRSREAAVRALAESASTRNWNLFIDVIGQSGRYPVDAKDVNDFLVEGEKRIWVHLILDRYTRKIIHQHIEPVYE